MKVWNSVCAVLVSAAGVLAAESYAISEGTVTVGESQVVIGEINTAQHQVLSLESLKDDIEVDLEFKDFGDLRPHQLVVNVGTDGLYASYVPKVKGSNVRLTIPAFKLPEVLKTKNVLQLQVVAGGPDASRNYIRTLGVDIAISDAIKESSSYVESQNLAIKPEIHHIFRSEPGTVNAVIPTVFIGAAAVLLVVLLGSWGAFIGSDLFSVKVSGTQLLLNVSFLTSLIAMEVTFVRYYLGQSIFTTLYYSGIFGLSSVVFGSKTLKWMSRNRKLGKA